MSTRRIGSKFLTLRELAKCKPGAIIGRSNLCGLYYHILICIFDGEHELIEYAYDKGQKKITIREVTMDAFASEGGLFIQVLYEGDVPRRTIRRAKRALADPVAWLGKYNPLTHNCEVFANWCVTRVASASHQAIQVWNNVKLFFGVIVRFIKSAVTFITSGNIIETFVEFFKHNATDVISHLKAKTYKYIELYRAGVVDLCTVICKVSSAILKFLVCPGLAIVGGVALLFFLVPEVTVPLFIGAVAGSIVGSIIPANVLSWLLTKCALKIKDKVTHDEEETYEIIDDDPVENSDDENTEEDKGFW